MIIKLLLDLIYNIFSILLAPIDIPDLPSEVTTVFNNFLTYIKTGLSILGVYVDLDYLLILFGFVFLVEAGVLLYHVVIWFIKKIPFTGIS